MSRRRRVLLLLALTFLAGAAGTVLVARLTAPTHRIMFENLERINGGMTEADVEALLRASAGDYSGGRTRVWGGVRGPSGSTNKCWIASDCAVEVAFGPDGRVAGVSITDDRPDGFVERLRRMLGL